MALLVGKKLKLLRELWLFARARKELWLLPVFFIVIMAGLLLFLAEGTVVAPFIYTVF